MSSALTQKYLNTDKSTSSLENRRRLTAAHVMSAPVITLQPQNLITTARQQLQDHDISHLVITDAEKKPLGLLNINDLLRTEIATTEPLSQLLGTEVLAVSAETLVRDVALNFMKYRASAIIVVNAEHQVMGIISRSDLLGLLISSPNKDMSI